MKNSMYYITRTTIVTVIVLLALSPTIVSAEYANDADIETLDASLVALDNLVSVVESEETSMEDVVKAADDAISKLDAVAEMKFSSELGTAYEEAGAQLSANAAKLSAHIATISVIADGTEEESGVFFDTYNTLVDDYYAAGETLDLSVDEANAGETTLYMLVLAACALLTIGSLVWSRRGWNKYSVEQQEARTAVVKASILPLAGAAITYLTWVFADKLGGTSFLAWGLIIFGLAAYGKAIMAYVTQARGKQTAPPASN